MSKYSTIIYLKDIHGYGWNDLIEYTWGPRIVWIQTVWFRYTAVTFLVQNTIFHSEVSTRCSFKQHAKVLGQITTLFKDPLYLCTYFDFCLFKKNAHQLALCIMWSVKMSFKNIFQNNNNPPPIQKRKMIENWSC